MARASKVSRFETANAGINAHYDDLVLDMFGDDASPPNIVDVDAEPTGPLVETKVKGTARYAYDAKLKQYTLVEGTIWSRPMKTITIERLFYLPVLASSTRMASMTAL